MGEVSQQLFLGDTEVFGIYDNRWSAINPIPYVEPWTPQSLSNLEAWWTADYGVTVDSTYPDKVGRWEERINGYFLTQSFTSGTYPNVDRMPITGSSVDLNNQPIIHFAKSTPSAFPNGAPRYMYTTGSFPGLSNQSYTQIMICDYTGVGNPADALTSPIFGQIDSSSTKRLWIDRQSSDTDARIITGLGAASLQTIDTNINITIGTEYVLWLQYQASSADTYIGVNTTTGSLQYNGSVTNDNWSGTTLFGVNGFLIGTSNVGSILNARANDIKVAEILLVYGEPSANEWFELKNYVSTKYGITIS